MTVVQDLRGDLGRQFDRLTRRPSVHDVSHWLILLVLAYVPFYLYVSFNTSENIVAQTAQDFVVVALLAGGLVGTRWVRELNFLDKALLLFALYNGVLLFISVFRGGPSYIPIHFHNYLTGILMYVLVIRFVRPKHVSRVIQLFMALAFVISLLYIQEWILVNVFKHPPYNWLFEYLGPNSMFTPVRLTQVVRVAGIFGHVHPTAAFIGAGAVAFLVKALMAKTGWRLYTWYLVGFSVCVGAATLGASLVPVVATLMVGTLVSGYLVARGVVPRKRLVQTAAVMLVGLLVLTVISEQAFGGVRASYAEKVFRKGPSLRGEIAHKMRPPINRLANLLSDHPYALLSGAGFPLRSVDRTANGKSTFGPVTSENLFVIQLLTQYGLIGLALAVAVYLAGGRVVRQMMRDRTRLDARNIESVVIAFAVVSVFILSTIHSGVILKYGIYYWLFAMLGILSVLYAAHIATEKQESGGH